MDRSYHEATEFGQHNILTPTKVTVARGWVISKGGVSLPLVRIGKAAKDEILSRRQKHELWLDPRNYEDNDYWSSCFRGARGGTQPVH
jgi:hypothetical protein